MIEDYIRQRKNLVNLFALIDSRHQPQKIDLDFINQLGAWKIPFALVFTKADKSTIKETANNVNNFLKQLSKTWDEPPVFFITSAVKKTGAKKILEFISQFNVSFYHHKKQIP